MGHAPETCCHYGDIDLVTGKNARLHDPKGRDGTRGHKEAWRDDQQHRCEQCLTIITETQAHMSMLRRDGPQGAACKDCVTKELTLKGRDGLD